MTTSTLVNAAPIVVFSKTYCPYCDMAKRALAKVPTKNIKVFELDKMPDGDKIQGQLHALSGIRTVPQVFLRGKFLGDGSTMKRLDEAGELKKKLTEEELL